MPIVSLWKTPPTLRLTVLLVAPAPVSVAETAAVVLGQVPACVPMTATRSAQVWLAARLSPLRLIAALPATAVTVPLPQLLLTPGSGPTCIWPGSASVKLTLLKAVAGLGLNRVKTATLLG